MLLLVAGALYSRAVRDHWRDAFFRALAVMGVAEVFDQTWFLVLVLSLRYGGIVTFIGTVSALSLHALACVWIGDEIQGSMHVSTLRFLTASLYIFFALLSAREALLADPNADLFQDGIEEAEEETKADAERGLLEKKDAKKDYTGITTPNADNAGADVSNQGAGQSLLTMMNSQRETFAANVLSTSCREVMKVFFIVLIGEVGDRTEFALVGLSGELPDAPVLSAAMIAFSLSCLSAIVCGKVVASQGLNKRTILGAVALSFLIFGVLTMHDAIQAKSQEMIWRMHHKHAEHLKH
jgi:putative Ca2+/H+ antiporter (TMEM165/GDT1 family)